MYKLLFIETGEYVYKLNNGSLILPSMCPCVGTVALWTTKQRAYQQFRARNQEYSKWKHAYHVFYITVDYVIELRPETKHLFEAVEV